MHVCQAALVVSNSVTLWTVAHQAHLSMGFSRQEYWSGLPFPSPGDLPDPEFEATSPALAGGFFTTGATCIPGIYGQPGFKVKYNTIKPVVLEYIRRI